MIRLLGAACSPTQEEGEVISVYLQLCACLCPFTGSVSFSCAYFSPHLAKNRETQKSFLVLSLAFLFLLPSPHPRSPGVFGFLSHLVLPFLTTCWHLSSPTPVPLSQDGCTLLWIPGLVRGIQEGQHLAERDSSRRITVSIAATGWVFLLALFVLGPACLSC